ncbi:hypothetical protein P148_SR1C00001G0500 [candidate division SR1 bacterium RAAC1_SR1_1]|nr:hypothetical protein P148_SR1C00001G0500 [candidate division SR1 bacterium RAAC1_SR1_1]
MKKYLLGFVLISIPLSLFAQMNISRVQEVIYDPIAQEEQEAFSSPLALGFNLYRMHMILAHGSTSDLSSSYEYARLILSLKDITTYNILELLEFEIDKKTVMDDYVSRLDTYLLESDMALSTIKEEMSLLDYSMKHCLSQKIISDKQYLDAVQSPYQQILLQEAIDHSKEYAKCASDAKIDYNAKKVLADKIAAYSSILKIKYDYLSSHNDDIVENYDLMKNDVLERLILIKHMLEKYDL